MATLTRQDINDLVRLLLDMNAEAGNMILIGDREREAIRDFDSKAMLQTASDRQASLKRMIRMEDLCRSVIAEQHDGEQPPSLERILVLDTGEEARELNTLRLNAYDNLNQALQMSQENRLRMLAAFNVVKDVLGRLGMNDNQSFTYGPGGKR